MIRKPLPPVTPGEDTADFRKPSQITAVAYLRSRDDFLAAETAIKPRLFLKYCAAVIQQKNKGSLTIRESAFAMSSGIDEAGLGHTTAVVTEATSLRRHPQNYRAEHSIGWTKLVERINKLHART